MTPFNRRSFVKTLAGTAAAATQSWAFSPTNLLGGLTRLLDSSPATNLENGEQQLRFTPSGASFAFQNFLRVGKEWKPATLPGNALVAGPSFNWKASDIQRSGSTVTARGTSQATGQDGKMMSYEWTSEITALLRAKQDFPWFRFRTTLTLPAPLMLKEEERVEPQIIVWLHGASTLMEGQSGSWRRILLQQPTRNSLGTYGNDLPGVYMLDQNAGVETMMYFDMSDMGWMSLENLPRFLVYRCSAVSSIEKDGNQRLGVGLLAEQATGNVLPTGEVRFTYYLMQRPMDRLLSEQEATTRWMAALLPLFSEKLDWPDCSTTWTEVAAGTVADLQDKTTAQIEVNGQTGLMAYVKDSSKLWQQPEANFELMTMADVLWPSLLYLRVHPAPEYAAECKKLLTALPSFYDPRSKTISNSFVHPDPDERVDSWYPFENSLVKFPMIGSLTGSKQMQSDFLSAFDTAQKTAKHFDYLFPIYFRVSSLHVEGAGTNYAIGGLYAWGAILAHRMTGEQKYLDEARRAIEVLQTVPGDRLFHEPQELGYAALAAAELDMKDAAAYLLSQQLRLFYWYSDASQKSHDIRGMVQACASILYPAFKENVEAILPWTGILKRGIEWDGLLRFLDQQRRNNFYFFERCDAKPGAPGSKFIPYENLGTLELGGQTGNVGKEIYGSGEVLWMELMFEALGNPGDRELMLVNLDLLDAWDANAFPPRELHFILFNPTADARTANLTIPPAHGNAVKFTADGQPSGPALKIAGNSKIRLTASY